MRGKLWFLSGLAAGFVLGARAGREKYEDLVVKGRKLLDHPTVQEAAGVAQAQANRLYTEGRDRLSQTKFGEKLTGTNGGASAATGIENRAATSAGGASKSNPPGAGGSI